MLHYYCNVFFSIPGRACCSGIEKIYRGEEERIKKTLLTHRHRQKLVVGSCFSEHRDKNVSSHRRNVRWGHATSSEDSRLRVE